MPTCRCSPRPGTAGRARARAAASRSSSATGGLYAGPPERASSSGAPSRARREQRPAHEVLDAAEIRRRWPIFAPADGHGRPVRPGRRDDPARAGDRGPAPARRARLAPSSGSASGRSTGGRLGEAAASRSRPTPASIGADHLVIAAGAWTGYFVPDLAPAARGRADARVLVRARRPGGRTSPSAGCRCGSWTRHPTAIFYGFPYDPAAGLKVSPSLR